jgi:AcrR family transcriptional regulator
MAQTTPRRTQQQRSDATRAALLDAALECLVEFGYAGTTTGRVCDVAGLSRGAHLHHFGRRAALVAAALAELVRRREADFQAEVVRLPLGDERIERSLDLLWAWFTGPLFYASVDLGAASRTDPELGSSLAPVERHLKESTLRRCREMFVGDRDDGRCDQAIQMTLATVRGLALLPVLQPGSRLPSQQWDFARGQLAATIRTRLAAPS